MKYCTNCGSELKEGADICLSCGRIIKEQYVFKEPKERGKALATLSVVFGSLGFYPIVIFGSIVGIITSSIVISRKEGYEKRAKTGLVLSIVSLAIWFTIFAIVIIAQS